MGHRTVLASSVACGEGPARQRPGDGVGVGNWRTPVVAELAGVVAVGEVRRLIHDVAVIGVAGAVLASCGTDKSGSDHHSL